MSEEKKPESVSIKLCDDSHTHQGNPCKKGDVITVRKDQADRLTKAGKAEAVKGN